MMTTPEVIWASIKREMSVPPMPELRMGRRRRREEEMGFEFDKEVEDAGGVDVVVGAAVV